MIEIVECIKAWIKRSPKLAERGFVITLLLVFFILALPHTFIPIQRDEAVILDLASHFPRYYPDVEKLPQDSLEGFYNVSFWYHPPMTVIFMIPFSNNSLAKLVTLLITEATFLFSFIFVKKRFGFKTAAGFLLLVCFNPDLIRVASFIWNDQYMFFFLFLGMLAHEFGWEKTSILTSIFASNCKISYPLLSLTYFGKNLRFGIKIIIVTALSLIPYWFWSWISTSNPLYLYNTWFSISNWSGGAYRLSLFPYFKMWYLYLLGVTCLGLATKKIVLKQTKDLILLVFTSFLVYNNASWSLIGGIISLSILFSIFVNHASRNWKSFLVVSYIFLILPQLLNALFF